MTAFLIRKNLPLAVLLASGLAAGNSWAQLEEVIVPAQLRTQYGNMSTASIGAIQRGLLSLESQGGEKFFGEPVLALDDLRDAAVRAGLHSLRSQAIALVAQGIIALDELGDMLGPELLGGDG